MLGLNGGFLFRIDRLPPLRNGFIYLMTQGAGDYRREFELIYRGNAAFVFRNLSRLGVPEAMLEDAMQDVFVVVYRLLPSFEGRSTVTTWLFSILRRVAADYRKQVARRGRQQTYADQGTAAETPYHALEKVQGAELLKHLLAGMSAKKRAVFVLVELEQMSGPETARTLEVDLETVYGRLRGARSEFDAVVARWNATEQGRVSRADLLVESRRLDPARKARIWAGIASLLAISSVTGTATAAMGESQGILRSSLAGKSFALLTVGALVGITGYSAGTASGTSSSDVASQQVAVPEPPIVRELDEHSVPAAIKRHVAPVVQSKSEGSDEPLPSQTKSRRQVPKRRRGTRANRAGTQLGREAAVLSQANKALASGDLDTAAHLTRRHKRRFPKGGLRPERQALELVIRCRRGERVDPSMRRFRREFQDTALPAAVRSRCTR